MSASKTKSGKWTASQIVLHLSGQWEEMNQLKFLFVVSCLIFYIYDPISFVCCKNVCRNTDVVAFWTERCSFFFVQIKLALLTSQAYNLYRMPRAL